MSNNCNRIQPAVITPVIALGSSASPYFVQVQIAQRLCFPTCVSDTPVFAPRFSVKSVAQGATVNAIAASGCQTFGRNLVCETPLTITVA